MRFHDSDQTFSIQHSFESASADVRHRKISTGAGIDISIFFIAAVGIFDKFSAVSRKDSRYLVTDRTLKTCYPVITVNNNGRFIFFEVFFVGKCFLINDFINSGNIFKHQLALRCRNQRHAFVRSHCFVRENTDDKSAEFLRFFDNGNVTAVNDVGCKAHINRSRFYLFQFCRDDSQVFRIVDLRTKQIFDIKSVDIRCPVQFVQSILGIDICLFIFTELNDLIEPDFPIIFFQVIKCLSFHRVVKNVYTDFHNFTVGDLRFEILFRKRQCR